jgi:threonine synthase
MLTFTCAGCGTTLSAWAPGALPFVCPHAKPGDDIDHVMRPASDVTCPVPADGDVNPFVLYRQLLASYARAKDGGIDEDAFLQLARELDEAVAQVDGRGLRVTPFTPARTLAEDVGIASGELWVKDETGQAAGSHKARHLVGIMLHLLVEARRGAGGAVRRPLAIASCGNAAVAAAVVARAAGWPLEVFVPPDANGQVRRRLSELSATVHVCERDGRAAGDPCYRAFREALSSQAGSLPHGAIPFCCQGSDNGLAIEGGKTIAWEMVSSFKSRPTRQWGANRLDAVFVQVGGGALASAIVQGFDDAVEGRSLDRSPRIHTIQTTGVYPLKRAYDEVAERILGRVPLVLDQGFSPASDRERAELIVSHPDLMDEEMRYARAHRSLFMRPWEKTPRSVAHGILDDETYDWAAVVEGMLRTGGWPLVVGEERLMEANRIAREATGIDVDHTGSAGLAGLMKAVTIDPRLASERVAVIFSGVRRA